MKGADISNYQSGLDLSKVDAEIIIIKATENLTYKNSYLKSQYDKCRALGKKIGFYHFLGVGDPILQAKHFLATISPYKSDCKYIIDAETNPVGISARVRKFADFLISQGKEVCLYTGLSFYNTEITSICKDIDLWVASYCSKRPQIRSVGWQYEGTGAYDKSIFDEGILLSAPPIKKVITPVVPTETYRIRLSWLDEKSQIDCVNDYYKAKDICNLHSGYSVYNSIGKCLYTLPLPVAEKDSPFRIRLGWNDEKSQIGCFGQYQQAKDFCNLHFGYYVYDNNGKNLYTLAIKPVVSPTITKTTTVELNVRSSASTTSSILGLLPKGTSVKILGSLSGFYEILYNGKNCYVSEQYVK